MFGENLEIGFSYQSVVLDTAEVETASETDNPVESQSHRVKLESSNIKTNDLIQPSNDPRLWPTTINNEFKNYWIMCGLNCDRTTMASF